LLTKVELRQCVMYWSGRCRLWWCNVYNGRW